MQLETVPVKKENLEYKELNLELPTDLTVIEQAQDILTQQLTEDGWSEDSQFGLNLVLGELLANAIIHGNLGIVKPEDTDKSWAELAREKLDNNSTDKKVYLNIKDYKDRVIIIIRDEGNGFDHSKKTDPTAPDKLMETKGRGRFYMEKFCDKWAYNEKGNEVTIEKKKPLE